jgi:hypothetical protein
VRSLLSQAWWSHVDEGTFGLRECAEDKEIFDQPENELRGILGMPESPRTYVRVRPPDIM